MKPIYENLDMNVSFIIPAQQIDDRKKAYEADVIYATNNELGFDFLRNNMVVNTKDRMMNDYYFAIIDSRDIVWVWYSIVISVSVSAIVGPMWVRKTINEMESSNESSSD